MKFSLVPLALVLSSVAAAAPIPPGWKLIYNNLDNAIKARNFAQWSGFFAPQFTLVLPNHKVLSRKEFLAEVKPLFGAEQITGQTVLSSVVSGKGQTEAAIEANFLLTYAHQGAAGYHEMGVDTWKKVHGRWQIVKSIEKSLKFIQPKGAHPL